MQSISDSGPLPVPSYESLPFWGASQSEGAKENGAIILLFGNLFFEGRRVQGRERRGGRNLKDNLNWTWGQLDNCQEWEQAPEVIPETISGV